MTEKWNSAHQHFCSISAAEKGHGDAIEYCAELDDGRFEVGNGEYGSYVNFCPVCGAKAPVPVDPSRYWIGSNA